MAEQKEEKSNFYLILGACAVISIVGVLILKGRETEHLETGPAASLEESASALHKAQRYENNFE